MGKKKLDADTGVEALVIGVVTSLKDYKLAWKINQVFNIELIMEDDLIIRMTNGNHIAASNYCYQTDFFKINLIKNKGIDKEKVIYVAPELAQIDYFFILEGIDFFMEAKKITDILKLIKEIAFVQQINLTKLKSRDNFIF